MKQLNRSNVKNMMNFYIGLIQKQWYMFVLLFFIKSVATQPLHLPAESFKCGTESLNLSCERWGYDACIKDGDETYCLPCNHEYLTTLCGTQEETPGCNLYCTEKALDKEIKRSKERFTEQLQRALQQADLSNTERKVLVKREKFLEQSLRNKTTALITISVALGIVVIIFIICCIRMKMNTKQRRVDEEYLNEDTLLNEDDRSLSISPFKDADTDTATNISEVTEPKVFGIKPDSIENLKVSYNSQQDVRTAEEESVDTSQGEETECKATKILKSIPATNTEGHNKFAINNVDAYHHHV